ncbi:hypothetical protein SEA_PIPER2020_94 [Mycobacterium phage Piper2020]|nr:hypothetical protein SEA_MISHA28_89 [Mycobacterium phage Misha28]AVP42474.1 hypothetical protein SEA_TOOTSIEPOP_89 [Mycobacterium phage TootsiePop]QBP31772.1 hypothetical protein SEA_PIPER2020_94 [Mycobacterium phage Piper2020]
MIHIEVDGKVLMHSDPGQWTTTPPDIPAVQKAGPNEPWMLPIMTALAKAATLTMAGKKHSDTTIAVTTRPTGWTLDYTDG